MIETENSKLNELRDRRPFRVPEGYFEGFTDNIMSRLPQKTAPEVKVISLYDRVKPWLYIAATFAGIILLFNIVNKSPEVAKVELTAVAHSGIEDDVDDEEFFENMYAWYEFDYSAYLIDN